MGLAELMIEAMASEEAAESADDGTGVGTGPAPGVADEPRDEGGQAHKVGRDEPDKESHEWRYTTLQAWVHDWLVPTLERDRNRSTLAWCSWWWKHPEAVMVLGALWHQWEASQDQPWAGMSSYLAHYHYPLLSQLTRDDGPFGPCWAESRSTRTATHREHDQHFGPPELADTVHADIAIDLGAVADWMPPPPTRHHRRAERTTE